jgi:hypothetical protein
LRLGNKLEQQLQPLPCQSGTEPAHAGDVVTWSVETGDEAGLDRIAAERERDRDGRGCGLGGHDRGPTADRGNDRDSDGDQIGRQRRQPAVLTLSPAEGDVCVLAFGVSGLLQTLRNAASDVADSPGDLLLRNPITGIAACCARAASGHAAAALPSSVMNARLFIQ